MYMCDYVGGDDIAYLIVGATIAGIILLSLLFVMFCCFGRGKSMYLCMYIHAYVRMWTKCVIYLRR